MAAAVTVFLANYACRALGRCLWLHEQIIPVGQLDTGRSVR